MRNIRQSLWARFLAVASPFFVSEQRLNLLAPCFIKFSFEQVLIARDARTLAKVSWARDLSCHGRSPCPTDRVSDVPDFKRKNPSRGRGTRAGVSIVGTAAQQSTHAANRPG